MSFHVPNQYRIRNHPQLGSDDSIGQRGAFEIPHPLIRGDMIFCIADDGMEDPLSGGPMPEPFQWEHVSVSIRTALRVTRMPTWDDMCHVKALFWDREDCVFQFHPPRSEYVNVHQHVLHLWRHRTYSQPRPPKWMVG